MEGMGRYTLWTSYLLLFVPLSQVAVIDAKLYPFNIQKGIELGIQFVPGSGLRSLAQ